MILGVWHEKMKVVEVYAKKQYILIPIWDFNFVLVNMMIFHVLAVSKQMCTG
jgi:hypothetical protein